MYIKDNKLADNKSKHETDFIIKHNNIFAEQTMKNEISLLLPKYQHGNNIHEYRKQHNK